MPQFSKEGKIYSKYSKKGVCTLTHILPEDPVKTKKLLKRVPDSKGKLLHIYGVHTNSQLVRNIFGSFLTKVFEKVAEGDLFQFPGKTGAYIALKAIPDKEVKFLRQNSYFNNYNIVKAGLKIPKFVFDFGPKYNRKDRGIYVPPDIMKKALKNAEDQSIPWTYMPKSL